MADEGRIAESETAEGQRQQPDDWDSGFSIDFNIKERINAIRASYEYLPMPMEQYMLLVVIPSILFPWMVLFGAVISGLGITVLIPAAGLAMFLPFVSLFYPKILRDRKRKQIRSRFHLFITHLTVLSTTNIDRVEVFRTLAQEEEYMAIAEEMGHIVGLIDTWNQSLEDACRMRAKKVPSPLMKDFLERLAYTVGAGQQMSDFLLNEQDTIIQQFAVRYQSDLDRMNVLKDLYMSMIMTTTFGLVFAILIPFLLGINPTKTVGGVLMMYAFVQLMFIYAMNSKSPNDPVWYMNESLSLNRNSRIRVTIIIGVALSLVLTGLSYAGLNGMLPISKDKIPVPIYMAISFTPLIIPAYVMRKEEGRVKDRDQGFPSFIRALGAVESVKQSSSSTVLESLKDKDFGALTKNIERLYRRLAMRIDSQKSWERFSGETGSFLIHKFSEMYVTGREMGGEPRQLGEIISMNMTEVLKLRQRRAQDAGTIIGVIYGLMAASTFAFFVGLQVIKLLKKIVQQMGLAGDTGAAIGGLLNTSIYNIPELKFFLISAVILNALMSALLIRVLDRGHLLNSLQHFVALMWIGGVTATVTQIVVNAFISF